MSSNIGGKIPNAIPKSPKDMQYFDRLPKYLREIVRNAALQINIPSVRRARFTHKMSVQEIQTKIDEMVAKAALMTYGPDHPQAKKGDVTLDKPMKF